MRHLFKSKVRSLTLSCAVVLMVANGSVMAESLLLGGYSGSTHDSQYGYIGGIIPIGGGLWEDGWRIRLWADYVAYDYDKTDDPTGIKSEIDADGFGGSAGLGYRWNMDSNTNVTAYANVVYRDIDLDPDDPTNDSADDDLGARMQLEINHDFGNRWNTSLMGSYTVVFDSYWTRLRPGYRLDNNLTVGPELVLLGGEKYDKQKFGAFVKGFNLGNFKLGLAAGAERERGGDIGAYGGVSLSFRTQ